MILNKNIKKWNEFLNEHKEWVEFPLKKTTSIIRDNIENKVKVGENVFNIKTDAFDNIHLIIKYQNEKGDSYEGTSNPIFVARSGDEVEINIFIKDIKIDYDRLMSTILHELKHVYDALTDDDISSFLKTKSISILKNKFKNNTYFDFINLVYLSLKHEMEARNTMIYDKLRWLKTFDDQQLKEEFKKTYVYKALMHLKNFDHIKFINQFDYDTILKNTNIFISEFNEQTLKNKQELINFYKKWEDFFHELSDEYLKKANNIIEELIIDKKPYMENINLSIFRETESNYLEKKLIEKIKQFI